MSHALQELIPSDAELWRSLTGRRIAPDPGDTMWGSIVLTPRGQPSCGLTRFALEERKHGLCGFFVIRPSGTIQTYQ